MKRLLLFPLAAALLSAGEYKKEDRENIATLLEDTRKGVALHVSGWTVAQGNFKPDSKVWSATEVIEHLSLAEDFLLGFLKTTLEKPQAVPNDAKLPDPTEMDQEIVKRLNDRTQKAQAPEPAVPQGKFRHHEEALLEFSIKRAKTIQFVNSLKVDLRRYMVQSPMGALDGHQWLLLMAGHTQRHAKQIELAAGHEMFPKRPE